MALIAVAVVFVIRQAHRLGPVAGLLEHVHWEWLLAGAGIEALSMLMLSVLQQRMLAGAGTEVPIRRLVPVTLAANAVSQSIPVGVLVAEGYVFRQYRRLGASEVGALWVELSAGAIAAFALADVAFVGALFSRGDVRTVLLPTLGVVVVGSGAATTFFLYRRLLVRIASWGLRFSERHPFRDMTSRLRRAVASAEKMEQIPVSPARWGVAVGAALANWLLDAGVLACALLAVGVSVPWRGLLVVYAAGQLLAELPFTPGGLGVVEGGLVELLERWHLAPADATAAVLAYRGLSFWLLIACGWVAAARLRFGDVATGPVPTG